MLNTDLFFCRDLQADKWKIVSGADDKTLKVSILDAVVLLPFVAGDQTSLANFRLGYLTNKQHSHSQSVLIFLFSLSLTVEIVVNGR